MHVENSSSDQDFHFFRGRSYFVLLPVVYAQGRLVESVHQQEPLNSEEEKDWELEEIARMVQKEGNPKKREADVEVEVLVPDIPLPAAEAEVVLAPTVGDAPPGVVVAVAVGHEPVQDLACVEDKEATPPPRKSPRLEERVVVEALPEPLAVEVVLNQSKDSGFEESSSSQPLPQVEEESDEVTEEMGDDGHVYYVAVRP